MLNVLSTYEYVYIHIYIYMYIYFYIPSFKFMVNVFSAALFTHIANYSQCTMPAGELRPGM